MRNTAGLAAATALVMLLFGIGHTCSRTSAFAEDEERADAPSIADQLELLMSERKWSKALEAAKELRKSAKGDERKELDLKIVHLKAQIDLQKIGSAFEKKPSVRSTLKKIEKLIAKNKRDVYFVAEAEALHEEVRSWLFEAYQPFEVLGACTRPLSISKERSRRGGASAKWEYRVADHDPSAGPGQIAEGISGSTRDWTGFKAICWAAYSDRPFRAEWWVLSGQEAGFTVRFSHKGKGWQDFRVELAKASKFGKPKLSFVSSLALKVESSRDLDIYLDDITLERPRPVRPKD